MLLYSLARVGCEGPEDRRHCRRHASSGVAANSYDALRHTRNPVLRRGKTDGGACSIAHFANYAAALADHSASGSLRDQHANDEVGSGRSTSNGSRRRGARALLTKRVATSSCRLRSLEAGKRLFMPQQMILQ